MTQPETAPRAGRREWFGLALQVSATSSMWWVIIGSDFISFFGAPITGLGVALAMGATPPEKMGSTGSLTQMANEFGGTLGIAILGTFVAGIYIPIHERRES